MPIWLIAVGAAVVAYIAFMRFLCIYVLVPLWPYMVALGALAGLLLSTAITTAVLLRLGRFAPATVTWADARTRLPDTKTPFPRDPAWPHYLFAQSRTDLWTATTRITVAVRRIWLTLFGLCSESVTVKVVLALWPVTLLPALAVATLTAAAALTAGAILALLGGLLALAWLGWLAAVTGLRAIDVGVRTARGAKATCHHPGCNHRSLLPAYKCPNCSQLHRDIRPGRQGAFLRRCRCGGLLPTTVLKAAAGLVAVCQECGRKLRPGAAMLTDLVVPVYGPTSAGKTRLIFAGMVALAQHLPTVGGSFTPVGAESKETFAEATTVVTGKIETTKTNANRPPPAITAHINTGKRKAHLHLFDAAGEFYLTREQSSELRFLDDTQGLIFVLDPFSIPAVADDLQGPLAARLSEARPAHHPPEDSYLTTAQMLADHGTQSRRLPLAIAIVKADLLLGLPPATGLTATSNSDDIERWLRDKRQDNLVDGARRDFRETRFYLVNSMEPTSPTGHLTRTSPARPLLWLLGRSGVTAAESIKGITL